MSKEIKFWEEAVSRRSFLKTSGFLAAATFLYKRDLTSFLKDKDENFGWPFLEMDKLPSYCKEILEVTPKSRINDSGVLEVEDKSDFLASLTNEPFFKPVLVNQTIINSSNLLALGIKPFLKDFKPLGLVFHWFGDTDSWKKAYTPHESAREYVNNGFGNSTSAMFVVSDRKPIVNTDNLDKPFGILQCELPDKEGNPVYSGHVLTVDKDIYLVEKRQYFVKAMNEICYNYGFPNWATSSLLQRFYLPGYNGNPNLQSVGIETLGYDFEKDGSFPSDQKISNILTCATAMVKYYNISSPAYNSFGHLEIDLRKGDPGKNLVILMKSLIALKALMDKDQVLCDLCFRPFMTHTEDKKEAVLRYFSFSEDYYKMITAKKTSTSWLKEMGFDDIKETIKNAEI